MVELRQFLLKNAIDMVATELGVSRFTVYNYLNEISEGEEDEGAVAPDATSAS